MSQKGAILGCGAAAPDRGAPVMRGIRVMASWVLALFLAVMYLWIADQTLFPSSPARNVVFPLLAERSGVALFEPTGRLVIGLLDALAALLMLVPASRRLGAFLALAIAGGAVAAHLIWLDPSSGIPMEFGGFETDEGGLFALTVALAVASFVLLVVHPGGRAAPEPNPYLAGPAED
jgi:hypothetical protein